MSILDRLESVYPEYDPSCLEPRLVDDCSPGEDVKVVLLCESPHTEEVSSDSRRPLVGKSGKAVAEVLRALVLEQPGDTEAIGHLVCGGDEGFGWLGLMNACQLPMQKKVYPDDLQESHRVLLDDLQNLHEWKGVRSVRPGLIDAIAEELKCRWNRVFARPDGGPLVVPCGEVARKFRGRAQLPMGQGIPKTPHPGRNQWTMALELYRTMERIRRELDPQRSAAEE